MTPASQRPMPWYHVPEAWLMVVLLSATVIGTFALLATAIEHPDAHISVPADAVHASKIPPLKRAGTPVVAPTPAPQGGG